MARKVVVKLLEAPPKVGSEGICSSLAQSIWGKGINLVRCFRDKNELDQRDPDPKQALRRKRNRGKGPSPSPEKPLKRQKRFHQAWGCAGAMCVKEVAIHLLQDAEEAGVLVVEQLRP